jgi:putative copper resistance protein D
VEAAVACCRFAQYLSAMAAFGGSAFIWLFAPAPLRDPLGAQLRGLLFGAGIALVVSALAWLALTTADISGDWTAAWDASTLRAVLFESAFGPAWAAHFGFCLAAAAALWVNGGERWAPRASLAGIALASLSVTGHASMQAGAIGLLHRANDAVHLLCAGGWLGGLIPFLICLALSADPKQRRDAVAAMMRFSTTGHVAVALLILTGIANIALTSGAPPFPPSTPYRALLSVKILLVAVMIGLAMFNRYALAPRLERDPSAQKMLRANCLQEFALGVVVVGLVSVFGLFDPY